jgi:signal transduction histidine kinase
MKDLTEAELIEIERRAAKWLNDLEDDPNDMSRHDIEEELDRMRDAASQIAQDVEALCENLRAVSIELTAIHKSFAESIEARTA